MSQKWNPDMLNKAGLVLVSLVNQVANNYFSQSTEPWNKVDHIQVLLGRLWRNIRQKEDLCLATMIAIATTTIHFLHQTHDVSEVIKAIDAEIKSITEKFGAFNSAHEFYAVLLEEFEELREAIVLLEPGIFDFAEQDEKIRSQVIGEAVQVSALAILGYVYFNRRQHDSSGNQTLNK